MQDAEKKKNWKITSDAFRGLLDWLDEGTGSEGQKYLLIRDRLVAYFDRKNCLAPDELADETLNRVARRLEEEGSIETETPAKYCYITARFVFMEYLRGRDRKNVSLDQMPTHRREARLKTSDESGETESKERMLECLEQCVQQLKPDKRGMIIKYYYGEERSKIDNRKRMAEDLGVTVNALSIRACRIRNKLEGCVKKCVKKDLEKI